MEIKHVLEQLVLNEDDCELCEVHSKAYDMLPNGIVCPECNHVHNNYFIIGKEDYTVVGETNGTEDLEEKIEKYPVHSCPNCKTKFALIPTKIKYNANHDVYYTGGKRYLMKGIPGIREAILPSIEQYTERISQGENLKASNLALWIDYAIENAVAAYLYEQGLKR